MRKRSCFEMGGEREREEEACVKYNVTEGLWRTLPRWWSIIPVFFLATRTSLSRNFVWRKINPSLPLKYIFPDIIAPPYFLIGGNLRFLGKGGRKKGNDWEGDWLIEKCSTRGCRYYGYVVYVHNDITDELQVTSKRPKIYWIRFVRSLMERRVKHANCWGGRE